MIRIKYPTSRTLFCLITLSLLVALGASEARAGVTAPTADVTISSPPDAQGEGKITTGPVAREAQTTTDSKERAASFPSEAPIGAPLAANVAPMAPIEAPLTPAGTDSDAAKNVPEAVTAAPAEERPATPQAAAPLRLRYSATIYGDDNATRHAPENMLFVKGSQYHLVVTPDRDLYLYLIREDAAGRFFLINPAPGIATSVDRLKGEMDHVLPLGAWFQLSALAGVERIHVIASPHRVERMELLVERGVAGTRDSPAIKAALQAALKEVSPNYETHKRVNGQWSELSMTGEPVERGVMVGVIDMRCQ